MRRIGVVLVLILLGVFVPARAAEAAPSGGLLPIQGSVVTVALGGRSFSAVLVQPTGTAPGAYPVVAFGHGLTAHPTRYASSLHAMAARGYVVVAPDTQTSLLADGSALADDLWLSARWAQETLPNAHASLDAVTGHSMGGGAALLAADRYPAIDTVATLGAAHTQPTWPPPSRGITVPALYVVGSHDLIVPAARTWTRYASKPAPARWASITGGSHCGFLDAAPPLGLGCDRGPLARETQLALTATLLTDWLNHVLHGDVLPAAPPGVVTTSK